MEGERGRGEEGRQLAKANSESRNKKDQCSAHVSPEKRQETFSGWKRGKDLCPELE